MTFRSALVPPYVLCAQDAEFGSGDPVCLEFLIQALNGPFVALHLTVPPLYTPQHDHHSLSPTAFLTSFIKLLRPGGAKTLLAENLFLKQQLLILNRSRQRAPNLSSMHRVLRKHGTPESRGGGPSWLTFLAQVKDSLWSVDLFRCESITLRSHWVLVVMDHCTRRINGFGVHRTPAMDGTLSVSCSIRPPAEKVYSNGLAPIMIPCFGSTSGKRTYESWESTR